MCACSFVCTCVCHGKCGSQRTSLEVSSLSCRSQVVKACALSTSTCRTTWQALLGFCFILMKSSLLLSKQTATDSSSNSSQKREQHTRTVSSPTSCEHRRIYTLDPYPVDHYHPDQVSRGLHSHGNTRTSSALAFSLLLPRITHSHGGSPGGSTLPHSPCVYSSVCFYPDHPMRRGISISGLELWGA